MVLFKSHQPDVAVPEHLTTWDFLFESEEFSPLCKRSEKPLGAFVDAESKERLDWAVVKSKSTALSTSLVEQYGLTPGETVTLFSTNTIWYPVCMFAILRAGGRINGASSTYTVHEMVHTLKVAKAQIIITLPASLERACAAAQEVGIPTSHVLLMQGEAENFKSVQMLIEEGAKVSHKPPYQMPAGTTNKELCGYLNFSSGTTGLPKAVMISHHNVIAQCLQMRQIQVEPDKVKIFAIMPLFHITGTWRFCCYPIFMNGDSIILPAFSMPAMLKAIVEFQIDELILVPPILLRLARDPIVDQFDLRHVKRWTSGAAPISIEVLRSLQQRFPWTGFRQGYGATEAACISAQPPTHYSYKYGASAGMLLSNTVAKVIDMQGHELGPGQVGEILARGPQVALGYLENEKASVETFDADGFYHTGDVGYIDEEGLIYIEDRIKEMIKVKGFQVPPAELENLLLGHEDVADCAVISQADGYAGERPKAFVVLKPHVTVDETVAHKLLEHVKENQVRYKWLAEIEFADNIPKSPAGKLLRRVLKERDVESQKSGRTAGFRMKDRNHDSNRQPQAVA